MKSDLTLPSDWRLPELHELALPEKGAIKIGPFGSSLKKHEYTDDGICVLGIDHVFPNELVWQKPKYIPIEKYQELSQYTVKPGDILVTNMGTVGRTCYVPERFPTAIISSHLIRVSLDPTKADSKYISWALNSCAFVTYQIKSKSQGAIMAGFNTSLLKSLRIPLPPLPEQRRIAGILDKADAIRRKQQRVMARMEDFLRSVFLDMFFHSTATHTEYRLIDLADEARSSFVNGPFGSDLLVSELQVEGVPVVYIRDIRDGEYKRVSTSYVMSEKAEKLNFCRVDPGDVLITKVGDPPGTAALYPDEEPPAIVTQDVIRIKVDETKVTSEFLVNYFNSALGQQVIKPIIMEATRSRFSLGDFKNLQIPVPCLEAQVEFSKVSQKISGTKHKELAALAFSDFLFESLSHLAFRGELTSSAADEILQQAAVS